MSPAAKADKEPKATEKEMLDLLEAMHAKQGNGGSGEFAFLRQVRNDAGFSATRTFDAVALDLWPSRGHTLHVFEVKVSRSDLARELAKPQKAEDAAKVADRFTIVAPKGVVTLGELPPTWGYIEASGGVEVREVKDAPGLGERETVRVEGRRLRTVRKAPLLHDPKGQRHKEPLARGFVVAMLRAAGAVPDPQGPSRAELEAARAEAYRRGLETARAEAGDQQQQLAHLTTAVRAFQTGLGQNIIETAGWNVRHQKQPAELTAIGRVHAAALADEHAAQRLASRLEGALGNLDRAISMLPSIREGMEAAMAAARGAEQVDAEEAFG